MSIPSQDLDAYIKSYDNLIIVISSFNGGNNEQFEHRGIFRNPISMLRKDYQGLGVFLHTAAAYARSIAFPESKVMFVDPDANVKMSDLLINSFPNAERCSGSGVKISVEDLRNKFELSVGQYKAPSEKEQSGF